MMFENIEHKLGMGWIVMCWEIFEDELSITLPDGAMCWEIFEDELSITLPGAESRESKLRK